MPVVVRGTVTGAAAIAALLKGLDKKVFRPAVRGAIGDASVVVVKEAKSALRSVTKQRTNSLYKSLGRKVKALKDGSGYYAVVGPRRDPSAKKQAAMAAAGKGTRAKFGRTVKYKGRDIYVDPAKYAHLVEFGRRDVTAGSKTARVLSHILGSGKKVFKKAALLTGKKVLSDGQTVFGPHVKAAPPMPFMRPAWAATEPRCYKIMVNSIQRAIAKVKPIP